jgi:hypothetical protein
MSKYSEMIERVKQALKEDGGAAGGAVGGASAGAGTSGGMVGAMTANDGNTNISYLPGGLSRKKKANLGLKHVKGNPEEMVNEQRSEMIHNIYNKLNRVLTVDLRDNKQVKRTIVLLNYWLSLFPQSTYAQMSSPVAVNLGSYDRSIRELIDRIKNIYSDDIGNLEMMMNAIRQDLPINAYAPFSEFDYVVGVRIKSEFQGIIMVLEMTINLAMIPTQSIYIESADLLEELKSYRTVKVLKDMLFPMGQMFAPSVFHNIKDIIIDLDDANEARIIKEDKERKAKIDLLRNKNKQVKSEVNNG